MFLRNTIIMKKLSIFYNPNQSVKANKSYSKSAGKPELIASLFNNSEKVRIQSVWEPLTIDQMSVAHARFFVDGVMSCERPNGFGNKSSEIAASLPWTNGSFYHAAKYAFQNKTVAMSPTSGFHHAEWARGEGFCTFNGLMIAAVLLKEEFDIPRIGIIDFDAHYGNGTDDIIATLKIDYIQHYTFGGMEQKFNTNYDSWIDGLEAKLTKQFHDCELLLYQAGADPHIDDPLGGYLTTEQMKLRDRIVFKVAKKLEIPLVWNLAGGYQDPIEKVLELHENTLLECLDVYF